MTKNCLQCGHFIGCDNPKKSVLFVCKKYSAKKKRVVSGVEHSNPVIETKTVEPNYKSMELGLESMLEDLIDPQTKIPRDMRIDDRDLRNFVNFHDFMCTKDGLNLKPFSRQLFINLLLFQEICPDCSNPKYRTVEDVPVDMSLDALLGEIVLLNNGVCPKCKKNKLDFFRAKTLCSYSELAMLSGQRVGKSTMMVSPQGLYLLHRLMKLPRPYQVYELNPTPLVGTLVAQTYQAAYEQLWIPMHSYMSECHWFLQYHEMLNYYGNKTGVELYKFQPTSVHYMHKNLLFYPSGPNRKTLRGKTRVFAAVDELDFFDAEEGSDKVKMNGREVYISLDRSLMTIRGVWPDLIKRGLYGIPNAYMSNVSSPDHAMGTLTTHVDKNRNSRRILVFHAPTWEVNPRLSRKKLNKYFVEDPIRANRDYGAVPPLTDSPFIEDSTAVERLAGHVKNRVKYEYVIVKVKSADGFVSRRAAKITNMMLPQKIEPSVMAIDAGFSNNSFALIIGHRYKTPNSETYSYVCDVMIEIAPVKGSFTLNYSAIANLIIYPLITAFNVRAVFADRWNSLKLLHDIEHKFGIVTQVYSLKYKDMTLVRGYIEDRGVTIPSYTMPVEKRVTFSKSEYPKNFQYKPVDHFYLQCLTVRDTGREVTKGAKLTDDLWRAFALGVRWLSDDEFCDKHLVGAKEKRAQGGVIAATSIDGTVMAFGRGAASTREEIARRYNSVAAATGGFGFTVVDGIVVATGK